MNHRLNVRIAARLLQMAELLEHQGGGGFRRRPIAGRRRWLNPSSALSMKILSSGGVNALVVCLRLAAALQRPFRKWSRRVTGMRLTVLRANSIQKSCS
jgi:hypothetical protein